LASTFHGYWSEAMTRVALALVLSRKLSRQEAFTAQGVTLAAADSSWSGLRDEDGSVVFALADTEIEPCRDGFRCRLWAPLMDRTGPAAQRVASLERLTHCLLARAMGGADGLVVAGPLAQVERNSILTLRVEQQRGEYWARWGSACTAPGFFDALHAAVRPDRALAAMAA
jgi:hypothetical protein